MPRAPPNHGTPVADYFSCASCNGGLENERAKVVEKMALIKFLLVYILQVGFCLFPDGWDPVVAVNCALILASHPFFANFCGSRPRLPDSLPWFSAADALPSSRKQPNSARRSERVARQCRRRRRRTVACEAVIFQKWPRIFVTRLMWHRAHFLVFNSRCHES